MVTCSVSFLSSRMTSTGITEPGRISATWSMVSSAETAGLWLTEIMTTLSMGQAAARFGLSLVRALQGESNVVECAYVEGDGEHARFFSQPLLLGKNGIVERKAIGTLSAFEHKAMEGMLETLKKDIQLGEEFVK